MIDFTSGDMFKKPYDARVNTVNCVGTMGAGVALAFKRMYPEMFKEYVHLCKRGAIKTGQVYIWRDSLFSDDVVINFPTKRHWKEDSRYEDIESGLKSLRVYLDKNLAGKNVALPALGCGHGNLDWDRVKKMIMAHLEGCAANVFVYTPWDSRNLGNKR